MSDAQYYRWQAGSRSETETTGDVNTVRSKIEKVYSIVSPSLPSWVIDNDLMQAAMEWAKRWADPRLGLAGSTPRACADRHFYRHVGRVHAFGATGSASEIELAGAIRKNPAALVLLNDRTLKLGGAAIHGSDLNLYAVVFVAEGDPLGTRLDQELLEQICLRDGLQYGDDTLIGKPPRLIHVEIW
jgi:hypothetical protein